MWEYQNDGMTYDDAEHKYTLDGVNLSSVTTLLKDSGIINNKFYTEAGANNGKRRHLLTELYDQNRLDWGTIGEADLPYLEAWIKFKEERKVEIMEIEVGAYHPLYSYAGRMDRTALIKGIPYVLDIKTGQPAEWVGLQLTLYGMLIQNIKPKLMAIYLKKNGNYLCREYEYNERIAMSVIRINQYKALLKK